MTGVAGTDWLPRNTSGGGALYAIEQTGNIVPCVGVSLAKRGVGRVGIGGMIGRTKTGVEASALAADCCLTPMTKS